MMLCTLQTGSITTCPHLTLLLQCIPNYGVPLHPIPFQFCPLWTWLWMCGSYFALAWCNNLREAQTWRTPPKAPVKALLGPSEAQHSDHFSGNCLPDLTPVLNSSFGMLAEIKNYAVVFCACHRNKQGSTVDFTRGNGLIMAGAFLYYVCNKLRGTKKTAVLCSYPVQFASSRKGSKNT